MLTRREAHRPTVQMLIPGGFTPSSEFLASLTTLEVVVMWGPLAPQACDHMSPR